MASALPEIFEAGFLARLERLRLRTRRIFSGALRAERRSRRTGSSLEFADYRNYTPGDDPRRIDWSIYGRIERLMLKLYEEEDDLDVAVLTDCSGSMQRSGKLTHARRISASLAYLALQALDRVTVGFFDESLRATSRRFRGRSAIHEVMGFLSGAPETAGGTNLAGSLGSFARKRRRGLVIVVSDCLDPAGCERGLSTLTGRHFALHVAHLLAPEDCDPGELGDYILHDCEGAGTLPVTLTPALAAAYRDEVTRFKSSLRTWCSRHDAGYSGLSTEDAVEDIVLRLFRRDRLVR